MKRGFLGLNKLGFNIKKDIKKIDKKIISEERKIKKDVNLVFGPNSKKIAIFTVIGTIMGIGIFAIPGVIKKIGLFYGSMEILLVGLLMLSIYLFLGKVVLDTKGIHQLEGYAGIYLGKTAKNLMFVARILGVYLILIIFSLKIGEFFYLMFSDSMGIYFLKPFFYSFFAYVLLAGLIYMGIKEFKYVEYFLILFLIIITITLALSSRTYINMDNITYNRWDLASVVASFGVIIFAFRGFSSIPILKEEISKKYFRYELSKVIYIALFIVIAIYLIISFLIIAFTGLSTSSDSLSGLYNLMGSNFIVVLFFIFSIMTMSSSFVMNGYSLLQTFFYDKRLGKRDSFIMALVLPFFFMMCLQVLNAFNFIKMISFVGLISVGIEIFMIILMYNHLMKKEKREMVWRYVYSGFIMMLFIITSYSLIFSLNY